jgi:hypothetical protein
MVRRSSWIPGSDVPMVSKHRHAFLTLLKNKGSQEERMTQVGRSSWIPGFMFQCCLSIVTRQRHVPGIQQEPAPFRQQEEA